MADSKFQIGGNVYWMVGKKKIAGQIIDIYSQNSATTAGSTRMAPSGQFLLIRTTDGKQVTKLDTEVEPE